MVDAVATGVAVGTTSITATLGSVSASTTLTVDPAVLLAIDVTPASPSIANGTTYVFTATGTYTDATTRDVTTEVAWSSSATTVGTISNDGIATGVDAGTTMITATLGSVSAATTLSVTSAVLAELVVTPVDLSVANGTVLPFDATGEFNDDTTQDLTTAVTWTSSDSDSGQRLEQPRNAGRGDDARGRHDDDHRDGGRSVGHERSHGDERDARLDCRHAAWFVDRQWNHGQFTATGTYSDGTTQDLTSQVTWTSSNASAASISNAGSSRGLATASAAGATTITAQLSTISGSTTLTVTTATIVSMAVVPTSPTVARTYKVMVNAIGTFSDATTQNVSAQVTWSSSNTGVATISNAAASKGLATVVGAGTSTIKAAGLGLSAMTVLTGTNATLGSTAVVPMTSSLPIGSSRQMVARGTFSDGTLLDITTQVAWKSSKKKRVSVTKTGIATALQNGLVTISAKKAGRNGAASISVP